MCKSFTVQETYLVSISIPAVQTLGELKCFGVLLNIDVTRILQTVGICKVLERFFYTRIKVEKGYVELADVNVQKTGETFIVLNGQAFVAK